MLKWCPKSFANDLEVDRTPGSGCPSFEKGIAPHSDEQIPGSGGSPAFEKSALTAESTSLWNLMSDKEKESLRDSARTDLQEEFKVRENELRESHRSELIQVREVLEARLENWSHELSSGLARDRHAMAVDAAGLAVALARKIIRDTVAVDQGLVVRTLETALYKAQDSHPLTVILHPDDAEYLGDNPDLMSRLRIDKIVPDRRMEKGGCRLKSGYREWDATLTRQVDTLAAIVEETLAAKPPLRLAKSRCPPARQ